MKHTIILNPFDTASVRRAIKEMQTFERDFKRKVDEYVLRLGNRCKEIAQARLGNAASVTVTKTKNGCIVSASGEKLFFVEFGTGVYAGDTHPWAANAPVEVYPGSWSENHAGTFQKWAAAGNDLLSYPYNSRPTRAMYNAYTQMCQEAQTIARAVFG